MVVLPIMRNMEKYHSITTYVTCNQPTPSKISDFLNYIVCDKMILKTNLSS